jgi:hypothetical protein
LLTHEFHVFGLSFKLYELQVKDKMPLLLSGDYDFYKGQILNQECLALHFKGEYLSIPRVKKHLDRIPELLGVTMPCVLWLDQVSPARSKCLIDNRIPFFVNEKMVFLPFAGTLLMKNINLAENPLPEKFTAATQCVFLWLLHHSTPECPIARIMQDLELSQASVARALLLLKQYKLLRYEGKSTRKRYFRIDAKQFWENGKKYMINPVQKRIYIENPIVFSGFDTFTAGEEALAKMGKLQNPEHECRAIYKKHLDKWNVSAVESADMLYSEDYTIVEIWKYNPGLFAKPFTDHVDLFSLYASLGNLLDDARIEIEIANLMEDFFNGQGN